MTKTIGYIGTPFQNKNQTEYDVWVITNAGAMHQVKDEFGTPIKNKEGSSIWFPDPPEGNHYLTTEEIANSIIPNSKVEVEAEPEGLISNIKQITYLDKQKFRKSKR